MAGTAKTYADVLAAIAQGGGMPGLMKDITDNGRLIVDDLETLRSSTVLAELVADHATNKTAVDALVDKLNFLLTQSQKDQVLYGEGVGTGATLTFDNANAENTEMGNAIGVRHQGMNYYYAAQAELDMSELTAGGDTITLAKWGVIWHFINTAGVCDVETPLSPQAFTSLVEAYAEGWVNATNTLPPAADDVCFGSLALLESTGGAAWIVGTDSIAAETSEEYKSFVGLPGIETEVATLALDASAATFTYGAVVVHLGNQARVSMTGKANVALPAKTNVADTKFGAWIFYGLADDVEYALQVGATYTTEALALAAIRDHNPNPYLPIIGYFTVGNASGAAFVPGTTNLDASGITTTFYKNGPGANYREFGRGQVNQEIAALTDEHADTLSASIGAASTLTAYDQTLT